jgi:hypothetical protein
MDTHELRLDMHLAESISEQFELYSYAKRKLRISYVREMYAKVLEMYGQKHLTGLRSSDQKNATALAAIFQQANEDGLVKGPTTDGKYEINVAPMDWQRASHRARNLAPSENHTPNILKRVFQTCHFRIGGRRSVVDELLVVKNFHKMLSMPFQVIQHFRRVFPR